MHGLLLLICLIAAIFIVNHEEKYKSGYIDDENKGFPIWLIIIIFPLGIWFLFQIPAEVYGFILVLGGLVILLYFISKVFPNVNMINKKRENDNARRVHHSYKTIHNKVTENDFLKKTNLDVKEIAHPDAVHELKKTPEKTNFLKFKTEFSTKLAQIILGGEVSRVRKNGNNEYLLHNRKFAKFTEEQIADMEKLFINVSENNLYELLARLQITYQLFDKDKPLHILLKNKKQADVAMSIFDGEYVQIPSDVEKHQLYIFGNTKDFVGKNSFQLKNIENLIKSSR